MSPPLRQLRERFLIAFPDFEANGSFASKVGTYHETYRQPVNALLGAAATHPADGWAVLRDVLEASRGRQALRPFFNSDVNSRVERTRDVDPDVFDAALDTLVQGAGDITAAVTAFNKTFWPSLNSIYPKTFRDTRDVPATVLAAVAPDRAISIRYEPYTYAERLLNNRTLFANKPMSAREYRAVLALAEQIRAATADWGWKPLDLWDIHGFILATCADRNLNEAAPIPVRTVMTAIEEPCMSDPTNLILYGPPGTGKTWATAREAVRLCDGLAKGDPLLAHEQREALTARYRELLKAGQIRFVTFHQSYSYEDFVEGLRPITNLDSGQAAAGFRLDPIPGVFRQIASVAEQAVEAAKGGAPFDVGKRQVFKMSLGRAGEEDHIFDAAMEGGYVVLGWGGEIDWSPYDSDEAIFERWNKDHPGTHGNDGNISQLWRFRCSMEIGDLVVISYGNSRYRAIGEITGEYEYAPTGEKDYNHRRRVRWLYRPDEPQPITFYDKPFTMRSCYLLAEAHLNRAALSLVLPGTGGAPTAPKQFVLICDEINRANTSKVFGELITLLEADKRIGMPNELRVALPYSKIADFGVPANLHVVGTMNTADRSIALLDTALRRRFVFEELMPRPDLVGTVDGIDLKMLLTTLNDRIEYLFDREHQIGHAYFFPCKSRADVNVVIQCKVIPLLAEYFYDDWAKIAAVLGDVFPDDGKSYEGGFLTRRALVSPLGKDDEKEASFRYRWTVQPASAFSYDKLVHAQEQARP